jgi:hypothetical protein
MVVDRRLSVGDGTYRDDARKIMVLATDDGTALLGYAGLGATAAGTEPADWMTAVLRGRTRSVEESLETLAKASLNQLPNHLKTLPRGMAQAHYILASAIVNDESRFYSIEVCFDHMGKPQLRLIKHSTTISASLELAPRIGVGGSGMSYFNENKKLIRPLLTYVKAYDGGKLSPKMVANYLAKVNEEVSCGTTDGTVGTECLVAWRSRKDSNTQGGGGFESYPQLKREPGGVVLPTIGYGMEISSLVKAIEPIVTAHFRDIREGKADASLDDEKLHDAVSSLDTEPDETLK